jgi:uncharacterized protein (TIGR03067 family)
MRRTILACAGVLLCVVALGSDSPKEYDDRTEIAGIEGTWRETEAEVNGENTKSNPHRLTTYRRGTCTIDDGDGNPDRGTYSIDLTQKPPHLDWMPSAGVFKGITYKFICQIDGDTLKICSCTFGTSKRRPQSFNDPWVAIWTYKRVK